MGWVPSLPGGRGRALGAVLVVTGAVLSAPAALALDDLDLKIGKALFERAWVPAPASTRADDGLGPLFDARSCASCHPRDGRAAARFDSDGHLEGRGVVLVLGRPDGSGDPVYGRRLQIDAVPGLKPEGIIGAADTALADGRRARAPQPNALAYGALDPATGLSLRVAPALFGRGAMADVPDAALLAIEAEQAKRADGISGRARRITRPDGRVVLGRFGWRAAHPDIREQAAEAFFLDLGMSTPLFREPWGDCTAAQSACRQAPHGQGDAEDGVEIPDAILSRVVAYVASLPVPVPAASGAAVADGARLFASVGCGECHRPALPTRSGGTAALFTDLLLHNMGDGLADTLDEPGAARDEWRTAPLAGVSRALAGNTGLLHDGRARTVAEAIAWHGGEAAGTLARYDALPAAQKAALAAYVASL